MDRTTAEALSQLIEWWKVINERVQAVEHANENTEIGWRDARRAVFLTLVVMYELDLEFRV